MRDPDSIRTTRFTDEHVIKTPRFLVLYLLLQSEILGDVQLALWYSPLDHRLLLETRLVFETRILLEEIWVPMTHAAEAGTRKTGTGV